MKRKWIATALLTCILTLGFIADTKIEAYAKTDDVHIYEGISIDGLDLSGDTKEEAQEKITQHMKELGDKTITFETELGKVSMPLDKIGFAYSNKDVVEQAYSYGKVGNVIKRYKEQKDIQKSAIDLSLEKTVSSKAIKKELKKSEDQLVQKAQNASLERKNGAFEIIPEKVGIIVDYKSSVADLKTFLNKQWNGKEIEFELTTTKDQPKYVSANLQDVQDVLGTFTTNYASSSWDRAENVSNGARHINGTIVYPKEEFSMYEKVQPYTIANGYRVGKAYQNGEVIDSIGGGICQVSTTLYNALIRAELEITERFPHSMVVTYVPLAADAAMAGTYKNLKFKNNTDTPIYIEAVTQNRNITFTIYGKETRPANREVKFQSKTIAVYPAGKDIEKKDNTMLEGTRIVTQSAHTGYKAELWKEIYIDGKLTDSELVNTSVYQPSPRRVVVGTKKKEEPKEDPKKEDPKDKEDKENTPSSEENINSTEQEKETPKTDVSEENSENTPVEDEAPPVEE